MNRFLMFIFLILVSIFFIVPSSALGQGDKVRKSLKASVTQRLGVDTDITIDYSRPGVKGRKIWGDLVPYGMYPGNEYSNNKPYPWRAGADENTTISFNNPVKIEGNRLEAGKYGIHMIVSKTDWIIIFSKKNSEWGSFSYDKSEDALRITVKPVAAPHQEWLTYGFDDLAGTSATAYLYWEKLKVPFKIELAE
jgi:hypothetical protein